MLFRSQGLSRFAAARAGASHQSVVGQSGPDGSNTGDVRQDHGSPAPEHTSAGRPDQQSSDQQPAAATIDAVRENGQPGQDTIKGGEGGRIFGESPETDSRSCAISTQRSPGDSASTMEKTDHGISGGRDLKRKSNNGWNARFKAASAKARDKRHAATEVAGASNNGGNRIAIGDLQATKQIDPRSFIERMGYSIKKDGQRHFSVRIGKDEAYRLTQKPDGVWLWLDNRGNAGGDNIDLVRELTGLKTFVDCVYELVSKTSSDFDKVAPPPAPQPPRIPNNSEQGQWLGRMYLEERGISLETTEHAERSGFLRYLNDGLLFVGRKAGQILNATKRAFSPDAEVQKRDLAGSDKQYPPILSGNNETLWIVEGGIDALALHDLAKLSNKPEPEVIVSGGSGVKSLFDNPDIQEKIKTARRVVVAGENEKNADVQAKTDAQHQEIGRAHV